jgi:uncharacterized protein YdaU (DUF1376 family)
VSKSPAFQFYPSDWLDLKVLRMSNAAQGVYMRLLCYMWRDSKDQCSIEDNDKTLAKILGFSEKKWKKMRSEIQWEGDEILIEKNGRLISQRLQKEKQKQMDKSAKARESANARWMRTQCERIPNAYDSHTHSQCSSTSTSSSIKELPANAGHFSQRVGELKKQIEDQSRRVEKQFPKVWVWVQQKANACGHPQAILEAISSVSKDTKHCWAWCEAVFKTKNPKYNEKVSQQESDEFKRLFIDGLTIGGDIC